MAAAAGAPHESLDLGHAVAVHRLLDRLDRLDRLDALDGWFGGGGGAEEEVRMVSSIAAVDLWA